MYSTARMMDALATIERLYGRASEQYDDAIQFAGSVCDGEIDPLRTRELKTADVRRTWAVDALERWCEGYDALTLGLTRSLFQAMPVARVEFEHGKAAATGFARATLRTSSYDFRLYEAAMYLLLNDALSSEDILGPNRHLTQIDLTPALRLASALVSCRLADSCGPANPVVLAFCGTQGCAPGSDFDRALRESLSQRDYDAVLLAYRWLWAQRRSQP
jgi:hypothetical protein